MMEDSMPFTFMLEVLPADANDADPALVSAVGSDVANIFREHGETVQPLYTGQRGGEFLVQIATLLTTAWTNKEVILSDVSTLVSILTPLVLTSRHLWNAYERRVGKDMAQQHPLTVTIEVNDVAMKVEAADRTDALAIATELAQRYQAQHPPSGAQDLSPTTAKVQAHVPKRPTRKRR
jgi:hypothetical protein